MNGDLQCYISLRGSFSSVSRSCIFRRISFFMDVGKLENPEINSCTNSAHIQCIAPIWDHTWASLVGGEHSQAPLCHSCSPLYKNISEFWLGFLLGLSFITFSQQKTENHIQNPELLTIPRVNMIWITTLSQNYLSCYDKTFKNVLCIKNHLAFFSENVQLDALELYWNPDFLNI